MSISHYCVAYADETQLRAVATEFLAEGLERGERVGYFGWGGRAALRERLGGLAGLDELIESGVAQLGPFEELFRVDEVLEPVAMRTFWADATDGALAAGFTAFRAVADTTAWLEPRGRRAAFLRGEHLVDRYRLDHPFALLCACDASALSDEALAEVACIHAAVQGVSPPFHLHASTSADFALVGEVDALAVPLLERVLTMVSTGAQRRDVVVDASGLTFMDHQSLLALEAHGRDAGVTVVLQRPPPTARLVASVLDLRHVRLAEPR